MIGRAGQQGHRLLVWSPHSGLLSGRGVHFRPSNRCHRGGTHEDWLVEAPAKVVGEGNEAREPRRVAATSSIKELYLGPLMPMVYEGRGEGDVIASEPPSVPKLRIFLDPSKPVEMPFLEE
ncbi:hypothetical protein Nepgr_030620 [Nepenthes gracilis]|uniref:Uncharacterized protein n=1 Tax=Nepenthes gracilis TaxID=150966 RepID=A0AAD3TG28_NEPGR|nr:hypothetical protein Nepgr_030620 [Nepenthes gracilis]